MELKIIDTGYLNASKTGTQLSAEDRAGYDGTSAVSALDMPNITSSAIGGSQNTNDSAELNTGEMSEVSSNSFNNETISISFAVKRDNLPAGTYETNYLKQIARLKETAGVKLLYPSGTGSYNTSLMLLGQEYKNGVMSTDFIPADIPYLPVIINNIMFTDKPTSKYIGVKITGVLTK